MRRRLALACLFASAASGPLHAQLQADQPAERVYKNIQVLKGVPASTFMNTMFFQRYSLGVSCNFCHVGTQWDKDDKKQKVTARKMLRMVQEINASQFDGKPAVNCMTCHRGSTKPVTEISGVRVTVQEMLGPRPAAMSAPPAVTASVDEVLSRYITALGGAEALAKIRNRVTKGNMITSEGSIVPFEETWTTEPASTLSARHFGGTLGDFVTGFDGTSGWNSDNRGLTEQRGQALAQLAMNAALENRVDIQKLYKDWKVVGLENVGSLPAIVLAAVSTITERNERLYFDVGTGLLVRRSVATESIFGAFTTDTYYENYRVVDGITLPTMVSDFTPDFGTIHKATSVEHNASVERSIFAKPAVRQPR